MTTVADASTVVAALIDVGAAGAWAEGILRSDHLIAPHSMPAEVTNVLQRGERSGSLSSDVAAMARSDLESMPIDLYPFEPFSERVWELRHSVNAYDAWYIALAEATDTRLATLDMRLARAAGPTCGFVTPRI